MLKISTKCMYFLQVSIIAFMLSACSSLKITDEIVPSDGVQGITISKKSKATQKILDSATIYFEYDSSRLSSESIKTLKDIVELMKTDKAMTLSLQGHADERGTREYNLALGQRRSESVSSYLIASGLSNSRMEAISYGEERPLILGADESSWQKNRRVEIK